MNPNDQIELVFLTPHIEIKKSRKQLKVRYRRLTGSVGTHIISPDKLVVRNCYDQLEDGKCYVVVCKVINPDAPEGERHWVWESAIALDDETIAIQLKNRIRKLDPDGRVPGYVTSQRLFNLAVADIQQLHKVKQALQSAKQLLDQLLKG
jgi:hypothetical protein